MWAKGRKQGRSIAEVQPINTIKGTSLQMGATFSRPGEMSRQDILNITVAFEYYVIIIEKCFSLSNYMMRSHRLARRR